MKFGISYSTPYHGVDPDNLVSYARCAEECGFESFYVPEHVVLYPGATIGRWEIPPTLPYFDPIDCLGFVAASTRRILLGTGVLVLPYHHPVVLAKRLATVDVLSKGRMRLLTVGLGGLPGEAAAFGVDYRSRGRRADEAIDVMRLLWDGCPSTSAGRAGRRRGGRGCGGTATSPAGRSTRPSGRRSGRSRGLPPPGGRWSTRGRGRST